MVASMNEKWRHKTKDTSLSLSGVRVHKVAGIIHTQPFISCWYNPSYYLSTTRWYNNILPSLFSRYEPSRRYVPGTLHILRKKKLLPFGWSSWNGEPSFTALLDARTGNLASVDLYALSTCTSPSCPRPPPRALPPLSGQLLNQQPIYLAITPVTSINTAANRYLMRKMSNYTNKSWILSNNIWSA